MFNQLNGELIRIIGLILISGCIVTDLVLFASTIRKLMEKFRGGDNVR